ncbi:MAG: hypothetical protein KIT84_06980 [Labilithrix sp.]|nr:hypothetical protein [Labilithrix sp.]MCW5810738.1 hypothetical protein [Labilithrix sp.]
MSARVVAVLLVGTSFGVACGAPSPPPAAAPAPAAVEPVEVEAGAPALASSTLPAVSAPDAEPPPPPPPRTDLPRCRDDVRNEPCFIFDGPARRCFLHESATSGDTPIDCPPNAGATLPPNACGRAVDCVGVSDEGCCVGCTNPFRTRISPACAKEIEAAKDCNAVKKAMERPGCRK